MTWPRPCGQGVAKLDSHRAGLRPCAPKHTPSLGPAGQGKEGGAHPDRGEQLLMGSRWPVLWVGTHCRWGEGQEMGGGGRAGKRDGAVTGACLEWGHWGIPETGPGKGVPLGEDAEASLGQGGGSGPRAAGRSWPDPRRCKSGERSRCKEGN